MKKSVIKILFIFMILAAGCKKPTCVTPSPIIAPPEMDYTDLLNKEIRPGMPPFFIDINKDGVRDIGFGTQLVGDPINQVDKLQFLVVSDILTKLPVNANEEVPVLDPGANIPLQDFDGFNWFELSSVVLVQKIISFNIPVFWMGNWKAATKKYLPFQVIKNNQRFNGWVEISANTSNEKIILQRAAISKVAEREVKAGL